MDVRRVEPERTVGGLGLGAADRRLDVQQLARFGLPLHFTGDKTFHLIETIRETQFTHRIELLQDDIVVDGEIARRLVGHVHVVPVVDQTDEGAAHRNHVVVGVRREDQHLFGKGLRRNGPRRVVGVGLAARPAGNGMLQVVEDVDVDLVVRPFGFEQFAQRIFDVV